MRILHYALGFPPYRTGGMTKFSIDLMKEQRNEGHKVGLLWPGKIKIINHSVFIKRGKPVDGIENFEVINPLPVSYDEGIRDFGKFSASGDKTIYMDFLQRINPDVIHIHTLMGLHKSLLIAAKERGIRLIFTTHDFFPICPKVTMFRHGQVCSSIESCEECGVCNNTALSLRKIQILQSPLYRSLKDSSLVKKLRKQHRDVFLGEEKVECNDSVNKPGDYIELRNYYYSMLKLMDVIHYNSSIAKKAYERVFDLPSNIVISISHSDITDNRKIKEFKSGMLRIRYLGPQSAAKGYYFLKDVLDELWKIRKDFRLDIHFNPVDKSPYMNCHPRYTTDQLERIFDETDVLVCPSLWYETFGYTVLEALSYGVPIIVSDHVGARDIVCDGCELVIPICSMEETVSKFKTIDNEMLACMNQKIYMNQRITTLSETAKEIEKVYLMV